MSTQQGPTWEQIKANWASMVASLGADHARARRELAGVYPPIRCRYVEGRVCFHMTHAEAVLYVERRDSVFRRFHRDSEPCGRCGIPVQLRREGKHLAVINAQGLAHLCPEDDRA